MKTLWFACSPRVPPSPAKRPARRFCHSTSSSTVDGCPKYDFEEVTILAKCLGEGTSQGAANASSLLLSFLTAEFLNHRGHGRAQGTADSSGRLGSDDLTISVSPRVRLGSTVTLAAGGSRVSPDFAGL